MTDKQRKEAERRREEERYRAREEAAKLSDFRDAIGKKLFALARRSPKLADWLEWDKNAVAVDEAIEVAVTARFLKVEETDDAYEEREKLQERIDNLRADLDDFNEHEADEDDAPKAKKLIEDYKNLEADMTITSVAIPPKMQNDFDSLEQGYHDVKEFLALVEAGFFRALAKASRDINVLVRTDKNGHEKIETTTGKGRSAKTTVMQGRPYKKVVADVQEAIDAAETALSATSAQVPDKDGTLEYKSLWGSWAWSQLEDVKGEFAEYDETQPEAMAKEAHLDFDKANVWLATAKPGSHWLGDWRDAEVLLSHGRLADPSTVAEVLVKWSAAMQDNEKLADMLRTEWVWLKHLYDEKVATASTSKVSPPKPSAPKPPPKPVIPIEQRFSEAVQQAVQKGARSVDDATTSASRILEAAGDIEAAKAGNLYWDARVRNVTSRAMIQAGVTPVWAMPLREFMGRPGGYIPPGADWTFQSSPLPAEEVANQKVENIREKLKASKEGQELLRDEARYPVPKGKAAKALWEKYTAAKDAQWQMQQAAKPYHQWQLWMASRRLARQEGFAVPDMDERAPDAPGMSETALRAAARDVGVLSPAGMTATASDVPSFPAWLQNELDKEATTRVAILRKAIEAIEAATPTPPVGVSKLQAFLSKTHTKKDARALHTDYRTSLPAYNKVMSGDWLKWELAKRGERLAGLEDVYERLYKRAIPPGERAAAYKLTPRVAPIPGVVQL